MHPDYRFDLDKHLGDVAALSVLNLGAGHCSSPISEQFTKLLCAHLVNVEVYKPVFDELAGLTFVSPATNINMDVLNALPQIPDESQDVVVMLDVLEHFTKEDGAHVLGELKRIARKKVVVFVPCKECPQGEYEGNPYQRHLSTWVPADFGAEWQAEVYPGFHTHVNPPADAGWFTWTRGEG